MVEEISQESPLGTGFGDCVRVVLVRPRNPLNIAAAYRAAKNFGFSDIALVQVYEPTLRELHSQPRFSAWVEGARVFDSLGEAVGDCRSVVGTSCLSRRTVNDEIEVVSLENLNLYWERQAGRRAILFGSEKRGLCNADLAFCNAVVRIPTTTALPSMNLGQAVAVCCYELRRRATAVAPQVARASATADELHRVLQAWRSLLGEPDSKHGAVRARRLERTLRRLNLSSKDAVFLLGIARDVGWRLNLGGVKGDG